MLRPIIAFYMSNSHWCIILCNSYYRIAPNFCGTIFSWISWFDFWSWKFSSRKFSIMVGVATCCAAQRLRMLALARAGRRRMYASTALIPARTFTANGSMEGQKSPENTKVSLLRRAFIRIESLWRKTGIWNRSSFPRTCKNCGVERQRELSAWAPQCVGDHEKKLM